MPHPVDLHVGAKVRDLRQRRQVSVADLSIVLEIPREQIENYERGVERISSSHLWELAGILEVPIEYFFEGIEDYEDPSGEDHGESGSSGADRGNKARVAGAAGDFVAGPAVEEAALSIDMLASSEINLNLFDLVRPAPQGRGRH